MKKVSAIISSTIAFLSMGGKVSAAGQSIEIKAPTQGYSDIGTAVGNILTLVFSLSILLVLVMLVWGGFEWIISGGDKEAVGKARNRIVNALVGLAVLSIAFALARLAGQFVGFGTNFTINIPSPSSS